MTGFTFKTYRCEWRVCWINVDQYGQEVDEYKFEPFPTREEALNYRALVAHEHQYVKERWIPNDATNDYQECVVRYREVQVQV
jgi:hypothetical protein